MADKALRAVLALFCFGLAACSKPEPLESRVSAYWQGRVARNPSQTYELEHPEIRGEEKAYVVRMGGGPLLVHSFAIKKTDVQGDTASVDLEIEYRHGAMSKNVKSRIRDLWAKEDGHWYHKPPPASTEGLPVTKPGEVSTGK